MSKRSSDEERRKQRVKKERRSMARKILERLGCWEAIRATALEEYFLSAHYPRVAFAVEERDTDNKQAPEIIRDLEKALDYATFECPLLGTDFPIAEYLSTVRPLMDLLHRSIKPTTALPPVITAAREATSELGDARTSAIAICWLLRSLDERVLIKYGRMDDRLYFLKPDFSGNQKRTVTLTLNCIEPERRTFRTKDGIRVGYRCGQPFGEAGIEWVEWPSSELNLSGEDQRYPVFIQRHVLDNLYRREARALFIKDGEPLVHDYLWQSLRKPKIISHPADSTKFLVEYRLISHKLGYLVGQRCEGAVLIDTFLFLTMDGTPEGDALWRQLQLRRRDKEYLGLDKIQTFLMTDVQLDLELVQILTDCGCGHLFRILKEPLPDRCLAPSAAEIRKYLNLDD